MKHKPLIFTLRADMPHWLGDSSQRVCRACDNLTQHYKVSFQGRYKWLCARLFHPMLRKGRILYGGL
jgi:hypothetical protein